VTRQGPDTAVLPRRIRPGFWDDKARCCGTAGVPALACDRVVEHGGDLDGYCRGNLAAVPIRATGRRGALSDRPEHRPGAVDQQQDVRGRRRIVHEPHRWRVGGGHRHHRPDVAAGDPVGHGLVAGQQLQRDVGIHERQRAGDPA
jgi:hypothetical protein